MFYEIDENDQVWAYSHLTKKDQTGFVRVGDFHDGYAYAYCHGKKDDIELLMAVKPSGLFSLI